MYREYALTPRLTVKCYCYEVPILDWHFRLKNYCQQQKALFGSKAFSQLDYIECDPAGQNARTNLCREANVRGFPTWELNGKRYSGLRTLPELAELSGYQGDRNFQS
jgi:hypothetical protein